MAKNEIRYAVAVRDGEDLWLHSIIKKTYRGDVYDFWPHGNVEGGWTHASYHVDGTVHIKHRGKRPLPGLNQQRLDASFRGVEPLFTTPIYVSALRGSGRKCDLSDFANVFEIAATDLPELPGTPFQLQTDLVEPGKSEYPMGWTKRLQKKFNDRTPWIVVTLWQIT
jgi:hypothetical protein